MIFSAEPALYNRAVIAALGLERGRDDFSVKVTRPADPLFWVRLETSDASDAPELRVTDFKTPGLDAAEAAAALGFAIDGADAGAAGRAIRFTDIAPGVEDFAAAAAAEKRVAAALAAFARFNRLELRAPGLERRRDKIDFVAGLAARRPGRSARHSAA